MIIGFENYSHKYNFNDVTGIIHVGAHHGQEYNEYVQTFGNVNTHWFEPLNDAFDVLKKNLLSYSNVFLYQFALGDKFENIEMFVDNGNEGQSSSLMQPIQHINLFPHITFEEKRIVHVRTLDSFHIRNSNVLVLDTQGYELKCLQGSIETLKSVKYVFSEFNMVEMYKGCPTFEDLNNFMLQHHFTLKEQWYTEGSWGDAFWIKEDDNTL